jgi:squalene-associated FAD-dependent desaturase
VALFDKRGRLGGLTWSFSHEGLTMDNGQHVFLRCCTAYLDFLGRIGSAGDVEVQDRLDVTMLRPLLAGAGRPSRAVLRRDRVRAPLHLARSLLGYGLVPLPERLRFAKAALALARLDLDDPALDQRSFASWLCEHGQSVATVSALWDTICVATVNLPSSEASLAMAAKVFQTGLLTDSAAGDIGWSRVPLGHLHGERSAVALRNAGVGTHLSDPVLAVEALSDQATGGTGGTAGPGTGPAFVVRTGHGDVEADGVVVALPHNLVEEVLPDGALPVEIRPSQLASSPIVNVHVHFDRRVTELPFAAGVGTIAQWVFDRTSSSGASAGQYLAVSISAADAYVGTPKEQLVAAVLAALHALFPAARTAKVLGTFVTRERNATFRASPGSSAHRSPTRTRKAGLVLAGAWTATGWPPTMEGAVRSGIAAARAVLVAAGQRDQLPSLPREAA